MAMWRYRERTPCNNGKEAGMEVLELRTNSQHGQQPRGEKTLMLGKTERRRRRGRQRMRWHHWVNGHESEQALGDGDGQERLMCFSPWGRKESDTTEGPKWLTRGHRVKQDLMTKRQVDKLRTESPPHPWEHMAPLTLRPGTSLLQDWAKKTLLWLCYSSLGSGCIRPSGGLSPTFLPLLTQPSLCVLTPMATGDNELTGRKKKRIFLTMFPTRFQDQERTLRLLLLSHFSCVRLRRWQPTRLRSPGIL